MDAVWHPFFIYGIRVKFLWQIRDVDRDVIEEEIARGIAGDICHTQAEVGVAKITKRPGTSPRIRCATQVVSSLCGREGWGALGCRPGCASVPGNFNADLR